MKITRRALGVGTLALLGTPALGQTTPARGGTLVMVVTPEPSSMVSALTSILPNQYIGPKIFDGLFGYDFDFNLIPKLALAYEVASDGLTVTLRLRPGVKWHDGEDFSSADVAWSLLNVWKPLHSRGRITYANVTAVDTPDPMTVVIHLSAPSPMMRTALSGFESGVLPKHLYEGQDPNTNPANDKPVGTGPFRFVEWRRGNSITLERNPAYWDAPKPYLDRIVVRVMPDAADRAAALETGEVMLAGQTPVPLADLKRLQDVPSLELVTQGYEFGNFMHYLEFNLRDPHFADLRVRQAVAMAINPAFVSRAVWQGYAAPATGPLPRAMKPFYTNDVPKHPFNVAAANALLDQAGVARGAGNMRFKIVHDWAPYSAEYQLTADYVKQALRAVGIDVEIRSQDLPSYLRRVYTDNDFQLINYFAGLGADPTGGVQRFYWSHAVQKGAPFTNASGYTNPEMDRALEAAAVEVDQAKRVAEVAKVQQIAMTDLPIVPLAELQNVTVANRRVHAHTTGPEGLRASFAETWLSA